MKAVGITVQKELVGRKERAVFVDEIKRYYETEKKNDRKFGFGRD